MTKLPVCNFVHSSSNFDEKRKKLALTTLNDVSDVVFLELLWRRLGGFYA